jgi:hypothetical protein
MPMEEGQNWEVPIVASPDFEVERAMHDCDFRLSILTGLISTFF